MKIEEEKFNHSKRRRRGMRRTRKRRGEGVSRKDTHCIKVSDLIVCSGLGPSGQPIGRTDATPRGPEEANHHEGEPDPPSTPNVVLDDLPWDETRL